MAKPIREKYISAKVTDDERRFYTEYTEVAHLNDSELVRRALDEYINNHPIKQEK